VAHLLGVRPGCGEVQAVRLMGLPHPEKAITSCTIPTLPSFHQIITSLYQPHSLQRRPGLIHLPCLTPQHSFLRRGGIW
jgi:hypothetical protein